MACLIPWNDSNIFRSAAETIDKSGISDRLKSALFIALCPERLVSVVSVEVA